MPIPVRQVMLVTALLTAPTAMLSAQAQSAEGPPHSATVLEQASDLTSGYVSGYENGSDAFCEGSPRRMAACEMGAFDKQKDEAFAKDFPNLPPIPRETLEASYTAESWLNAYDHSYMSAIPVGGCGNGHAPEHTACNAGAEACSHDAECSRRQATNLGALNSPSSNAPQRQEVTPSSMKPTATTAARPAQNSSSAGAVDGFVVLGLALTAVGVIFVLFRSSKWTHKPIGVPVVIVAGLLFTGAVGAVFSPVPKGDGAHAEGCSSDWAKCADNADLVNNWDNWWFVKSQCQSSAVKLAKYGDPKWHWASFGTFFPGDEYVRSGTVVAIEPDAQFQNAFGAMVHSQVICRYDLKSNSVVDVEIVPAR